MVIGIGSSHIPQRHRLIRPLARESADIGYAAAVLPVEGGVGTPNGPLQLVSFSDIRENCQKQWGNDPTALALCQGRGMVGKYGFEQTHLAHQYCHPHHRC